MSFNGTRSAATRSAVIKDLNLATTPVQTAELWLEDKCESENFLFLDGQEVHIQGSIVGTLEIAINEDICAACNGGSPPDVCSVNALSFLDPSNPTEPATVYPYSTLCTASTFAAANPIRFFVYASKGSHSLCDGTCHDQELIVCPYTLATPQEVAAANGMPKTIVVGGNNEANGITSFAVNDADDIAEKVIATVGATVIDTESEDDILEDHNARSLLIGSSGSDTLISRGGRDALWGGNDAQLSTCTNMAWP